MLFCAGILFVIGYYYFMNKQYSISIFFIMLGGLSLRILPSTDILLHPWDERYHALVAKNLLLNPLKPLLYKNAVLPFDYKYWPECHIWLHKQPLTIWFISISYLFFGISEFSTRIPSIILSTFGIFLTYKRGEYVFNQKPGLFAGFLYAINGNIIGHMSGRYATDHTEISFLFFIQLAVLFSFFSAQKNGIMNSVLVGVFIGMAILCKWLVALIVIPLFIIIQLHSVNFSYSSLFY